MGSAPAGATPARIWQRFLANSCPSFDSFASADAATQTTPSPCFLPRIDDAEPQPPRAQRPLAWPEDFPAHSLGLPTATRAPGCASPTRGVEKSLPTPLH